MMCAHKPRLHILGRGIHLIFSQRGSPLRTIQLPRRPPVLEPFLWLQPQVLSPATVQAHGLPYSVIQVAAPKCDMRDGVSFK